MAPKSTIEELEAERLRQLASSMLHEEGVDTLRSLQLWDRLGRRAGELHKLSPPHRQVFYAAEWGVAIKIVPPEFYRPYYDRKSYERQVIAAMVDCPCGTKRHVRKLGEIVKCDCGRYFFFTGEILYSLSRPDITPEAPTPQ